MGQRLLDLKSTNADSIRCRSSGLTHTALSNHNCHYAHRATVTLGILRPLATGCRYTYIKAQPRLLSSTPRKCDITVKGDVSSTDTI